MRKSFFFSALILLAATGTHAQDVNTQSCEKGNGQACYLAAIEMHKAKNFGRAAELAQKACDLNYAQGCFYLGFTIRMEVNTPSAMRFIKKPVI